MHIYLSVTPQALDRALQVYSRFAHVAYRIGADSCLTRQRLHPRGRGGLLSLSDSGCPPILRPERLCRALVQECTARSYEGVVADFEACTTPDRIDFLSMLQGWLAARELTLYLPESYAAHVTGATALICTALSGGRYGQRLQEARARFGSFALDVQRLAMDFTVPAPSGLGRPLSPGDLSAMRKQYQPSVFFSRELCTRYFTYTYGETGHFVLFDDVDTISQKLRVGKTMGCSAAFLMFPEVEDLIPPLRNF